jgi:hypothetical protein
MKSSKSLLATRFWLLCALAVVCGVSTAGAQGIVLGEAVPSDATPALGSTITVDINIDVSGTVPVKLLGSFTGSLRWNGEVLRFASHSGIKVPFTGVVNDMNARAGQLSFNGANAAGASGKSNVLTLTFTVMGGNGVNTALDLEFTAMLSALDFSNLLPLLTVNDGIVTTAVREHAADAALPKDFALGQNFPNPFNPVTEISYELPRQSQMTLVIFNLMGQKVKTLIHAKIAAGRHTVRWEGKDEAGTSVPSGVYVYRMTAEGVIFQKSMTLLK